jgi:hypothetical protein
LLKYFKNGDYWCLNIIVQCFYKWCFKSERGDHNNDRKKRKSIYIFACNIYNLIHQNTHTHTHKCKLLPHNITLRSNRTLRHVLLGHVVVSSKRQYDHGKQQGEDETAYHPEGLVIDLFCVLCLCVCSDFGMYMCWIYRKGKKMHAECICMLIHQRLQRWSRMIMKKEINKLVAHTHTWNIGTFSLRDISLMCFETSLLSPKQNIQR